MTDRDYQAVCDWTRNTWDEWRKRKDQDVRATLPSVRFRSDEYERPTVGHLGFDTWNREDLTLDYIKSNKRPGHMRITAHDIASGFVQVKVGARYVDIREVIREVPDELA